MARSKKQNICVIGTGRLGAAVVEQFIEIGQPVIAIDIEEKNLNKLKTSPLVTPILADGADINVLQSIGIQEVDSVIVALSNNIEIVAALLDLNIEHIIARASSSRHARVLRQIGVDVIIRPEQETGIRTALIATNSNFIKFSKNLTELGDGFVIGSSSVLSNKYVNTPIKDLKFTKNGITLVLIKRGNKTFLPNGELVLNIADVITVVGQINDITKFFGQLNENNPNFEIKNKFKKGI